MSNPDSFVKSEFLNELRSATERTRQQTKAQSGPETSELSASHTGNDAVLDDVAREIIEQFRLGQILEEVCLATGATGAAIALARGQEMVCRATIGPDAPDMGVCLDPHSGLSGSCMQTRQLQQCRDTDTDPRVDPEACRQLGVRSILVLPLMDGNELLGIVEILSSRPNAFGESALDSLQALSAGILENREPDPEVPAKGRSGGSVSKSFLRKLEQLSPRAKNQDSRSDVAISRQHHALKGTDIRTFILGIVVIAAAILLGGLLGWRLGWQSAAARFRHSSPLHRANDPSGRATPSEVLPPTVKIQPGPQPEEHGHPASMGKDRDGPGATKKAAQPAQGGLTIHQNGKIIYRTKPPAPPPTRGSQPSQSSPNSEGDLPQ